MQKTLSNELRRQIADRMFTALAMIAAAGAWSAVLIVRML